MKFLCKQRQFLGPILTRALILTPLHFTFLVALTGCINYYERGLKEYEKGDYKTAIEDFKKAVEKHPNHWGAYYQLSYVYRDFKDAPNNRDHAYEYANQAISLCPKDNKSGLSSCYSALADLYRTDKNIKEAIKYYKKSIELDPDDYQTQFFYGTSLVAIGNYQAGIAHVKKSLKINPDYQNAKNFLNTIRGY